MFFLLFAVVFASDLQLLCAFACQLLGWHGDMHVLIKHVLFFFFSRAEANELQEWINVGITEEQFYNLSPRKRDIYTRDFEVYFFLLFVCEPRTPNASVLFVDILVF